MNPIYKKCFLRMVLFLGYGFLGGWLFSLIERREEPHDVSAMRMLDNLKKEIEKKYNIAISGDFDKFVETASKASRMMSKPDWTFLNGCAFTFAAVTTVGYGHITPETALGQGLTVPLCLIGLPITMLALKTAGEVLLIGLDKITIFIEQSVLRRKNPQRKMIKSFLMITFWITLVISILAAAETYVNGWTFIEGVYCWFVTFTTIGFGDYLPFQKLQLQTGKKIWVLVVAGTLSFVPYVMGLCLVSSLLNLIVEYSEEIRIRFNRFSCCTVCCCNCNNRSSATSIDSKIDDHNIELHSNEPEEVA